MWLGATPDWEKTLLLWHGHEAELASSSNLWLDPALRVY